MKSKVIQMNWLCVAAIRFVRKNFSAMQSIFMWKWWSKFVNCLPLGASIIKSWEHFLQSIRHVCGHQQRNHFYIPADWCIVFGHLVVQFGTCKPSQICFNSKSLFRILNRKFVDFSPMLVSHPRVLRPLATHFCVFTVQWCGHFCCAFMAHSPLNVCDLLIRWFSMPIGWISHLTYANMSL